MRRMILFLFLALASQALATSTELVTVDCPVCGNQFKAERCRSSNGLGGQDRDFCEHAAGGQVFIIHCWTCPRCCYTGWPGAFDPEKAPKELIEKLMKENTLKPAEPIDPKLGDSRKIPPWVRYDLWIQALKLDPATTAQQLADACLSAAQTQRFDWDVLKKGDFGERMNTTYTARWRALPEERRNKYTTNQYDVDMTIARSLESEAADGGPRLDAAGRLDAYLGAAVLYKRRGEDADAQRVLAAVGGLELGPEPRALVEEIRIRIERERKYRLLAIPHYERHLAEGKPDAEEAIAIQYVVGVLYRRVGEPKKAIATLAPLPDKEGIPDDFLEWIRDELAKAKAG